MAISEEPNGAASRSSGFTATERYLAKIAGRTFLNLWSYPNLFTDKKQGGKGAGKELCDLLAVCGDDIFIFSDKHIQWPSGKDVTLAWQRWYRRAVDQSVAQIIGAERWLNQFPQRVFLDPGCTKRLPIELPPPERRRVHGVAVAIGASQACGEYFDSASSTLVINPELRGSAELFVLGDVSPENFFIHVFDGAALDLIMYELNTVTDFAKYLVAREDVIRRRCLICAPGEEELLGYYLQSEGPGGGHGFLKRNGKPFGKDEHFGLEQGFYRQLVARPEYRAKRKSDAGSYAWDEIIERFTRSVLDETGASFFGEKPIGVESAERALRIMALESRVNRRVLSVTLRELLIKAEERRTDRYARVILPNDAPATRDLIYVFLVLAFPTEKTGEVSYEQYRNTRVSMLHAYCLNALEQNRNRRRAVGFAIDASPKVTGRPGGSEDLLAMEIETWTSELEAQASEAREAWDLLNPARVEHSRYSDHEFPVLAPVRGEKLSRQRRRALERARRKAERRNR